MSKTIELNEGDFAFVMEFKGPSIDGSQHIIKLFAGEEQIGLTSNISIHIPKSGEPKIEVSFIGSDLNEADKLVLSKHLKNRVNEYAKLLHKIPGIVVHS
jgi:hypothetical protein